MHVFSDFSSNKQKNSLTIDDGNEISSTWLSVGGDAILGVGGGGGGGGGNAGTRLSCMKTILYVKISSERV